MPLFKLTYLLCLANLITRVDLLNNGLALKPPMGWMSWGYYECGDECGKNPEKCLNENLILSVADHFYNDGYLEAGYEYIIIDDCWSEKRRDDKGRLVANKERFPRGMKFLADYIHSKGLKFGMYLNVANITCKQYPGSRGHLETDARMLADWDVDYVKVDGCFVEEDYLNRVYIELGHHLNSTGRKMVYSCSWPYYLQFIHHTDPKLELVAQHCNLWRNYHDIFPYWGNVVAVIRFYEQQHPVIAKVQKPGSWFDPDMLVIGTGSLTPGQNRVQIAVYSLLSSPLIMSFDMDRISREEKELLLNLNVLAIAQDELGLPAKPFILNEWLTLWVKEHHPLKGNTFPSFSFALVNLHSTKTMKTSIEPHKYRLNSTDQYTLMDVFKRQFLKNISVSDKLTLKVPPEDAVLYSLYPL